MSSLVPQTKAEEILGQLVDLNKKSIFINDFQASKLLREIDVSVKTGVDISKLWICKGLVYSFSKQPKKMVNAFSNASRLGATDYVSSFNKGTKYMFYGYNEEAINSFAKVLDIPSHQHLERIAISSLNFSNVKDLMIISQYKESLEKCINETKNIGVDINQAKIVMEAFFEIIRKHEVTIALARQNITNEEYQLIFHSHADIEITTIILKEFDNLTSTPELFEASTKLNIVLLPEKTSEDVAP
jgi:hypothetical protein